jgi:signal recognition particle receptor subunit beta
VLLLQSEQLTFSRILAFLNTLSHLPRHLHNVLHEITSLPPSQQLPSLLIIAHKVDLLNTGSATGSPETTAIARVKTVLERELEKRRASQSSGVGVEGLGEEGEKASELGGLETVSANAAFKFDDWEGGEVVFIATSSKPSKEGDNSEKPGISLGSVNLMTWISEYM